MKLKKYLIFLKRKFSYFIITQSGKFIHHDITKFEKSNIFYNLEKLKIKN